MITRTAYVVREHSDTDGTYYLGEYHVIVHDVLAAKKFATIDAAKRYSGVGETIYIEIEEVEISYTVKGTVLRIEPEPEYE